MKGPARGDGPTAVNLYDAAGGAFLRTVATGTTPAFSPDGATIAYGSADGWIELVPTAGGAPAGWSAARCRAGAPERAPGRA